VPTDPYIPARPDARPRQQQNLPPGVAPPPGARWRAERPGDLRGPLGESGPLGGTPGPSVGYAYALAERARDRFSLGPHEHDADAVAVVAEIAAKRAAAFGRAPVMPDVELAAALLGYDGSALPAFTDARSRLVSDAAHSYRRRRSLVDEVPAELLHLPAADVRARAAQWRSALAERVAATA